MPVLTSVGDKPYDLVTSVQMHIALARTCRRHALRDASCAHQLKHVVIDFANTQICLIVKLMVL